MLACCGWRAGLHPCRKRSSTLSAQPSCQPSFRPSLHLPPPTQDLTPRAKDSLVSFGERLSTRLFAAYLNAQGIAAKQYDAYAIGVTTNDNFVNAEVRCGCWAEGP